MNPMQDDRFETTNCPLCGSAKFSAQTTAPDLLYGSPGVFQLVRCRSCRHVFLNPRPRLEHLAEFYPAEYGPHHLTEPQPMAQEAVPTQPSSSTGTAQPWYLSKSARRLPGLRRLYYWLTESRSEFIPNVDSRSPCGLELGCADGAFLERMRSRGWSMQGVEFVAEPACRAAARGFDVRTGTLESAQFPDAIFDAVFAWMVLEHLHDPPATLREIRRILKPGGWLAFSVPNYACWERRLFGRYWYALQLPTHLQHYTPRTLRRMLDQTGFELVRLDHQRNVLNLIGSTGLLLRNNCGWPSLGQKMSDYTSHPGLWIQLACAPVAKLLAWRNQGGRLTIAARVRD